jgi:hypothetical protein
MRGHVGGNFAPNHHLEFLEFFELLRLVQDTNIEAQHICWPDIYYVTTFKRGKLPLFPHDLPWNTVSSPVANNVHPASSTMDFALRRVSECVYTSYIPTVVMPRPDVSPLGHELQYQCKNS